MSSGPNQPGGEVCGKQRFLCFAIRTKDIVCNSVAAGIALVIIGIGRIEQVICTILLPKRGGFHQITFPALINCEQFLRFSLESQPIVGHLLNIQPDLITAAVAIILPKHVALTVAIYEAAWINRASLVGLADEWLRIG